MKDETEKPQTDTIHHVAISVSNISRAVAWYTENFKCRVRYQDDTWAFLEFANVKLALVIPSQHPPHVAVASREAAKYGPLVPHRDGTRSVYITDPDGNSVEIIEED